MKHPDREEWVPYLFGEADLDTRKSLAAHLNACSQCAEEVHEWRKSLQRLDAWKVPPPQQRLRRLPAFNPLLNLAAAALLVLGVGFIAGRWFSPSADPGQLRAGLEQSLKAVLVPELRQQVRQELAAEWQIKLDQIQQDVLARVKTEAANASAAEIAQALQQLIAAMDEDQQAVAKWLGDLRTQHETDYVALRKDLETLASSADEEIRAASMKLIELTALNPTALENQ